jgi:hypothetical protein
LKVGFRTVKKIPWDKNNVRILTVNFFYNFFGRSSPQNLAKMQIGGDHGGFIFPKFRYSGQTNLHPGKFCPAGIY